MSTHLGEVLKGSVVVLKELHKVRHAVWVVAAQHGSDSVGRVEVVAAVAGCVGLACLTTVCRVIGGGLVPSRLHIAACVSSSRACSAAIWQFACLIRGKAWYPCAVDLWAARAAGLGSLGHDTVQILHGTTLMCCLRSVRGVMGVAAAGVRCTPGSASLHVLAGLCRVCLVPPVSRAFPAVTQIQAANL